MCRPVLFGAPARGCFSAVGFCVAVVGCGSSSPSEVQAISGADQSAQSGTVLPEPIRYRVVDEAGNGVPGVFVFHTTIGESGGLMRTATSPQSQTFSDTTNELGEGEFWWALGGPIGEQLASTTVVDDLQRPIDGVRSVLYRATALLGPPHTITPLNGSLGSAEVGQAADQLVVGVYDSLQNPIPNVDVAWAVVAGGGAVAQMTSTTDSMGMATTVLTVGPSVGDNVVTATVGSRQPATFSVIGLNPVPDVVGDRVPGAGGVPPDLVAYGAVVVDGTVVFHMRFAQDARSSVEGGANTVHGFIEIDIDQNPNTGNLPIIDVRPDTTISGMGIEFRIPIQLVSGQHTVSILPSGQTVYRAPAEFSGRVITVRVPLTALGDDGNLDYGILVGTPQAGLGILDSTAPTDWSPDSGAETLVPTAAATYSQRR